MQTLLHDFPAKMEMLFRPSRYKVAWGGRGSSKSWSFARALLMIGMEPSLLWPGYNPPNGLRVLCFRETMHSIAESVHEVLTEQIGLLGLGYFYREQYQRHIVGRNGTEFIFAGVQQSGVKNLKSYEDVDIAWGSQAEAFTKRSLNIILPTIRKDIAAGGKQYESEIWFDFNPEFVDDEIYKMFVAGPVPDNAQVANVNWRDNPWFTGTLMKEMENLRRRDPDECDHVYEGMLRTTVEGAIYKNELKAAEQTGRLTGRVPYDPTRTVETYWDIGPAHTRIWLAQSFPFEFRIIDYISGELESLSYYTKALREKPYTYGKHTLPWDGTAKELGSGRSIQEQLQAIFGKDRVKCAKQLSIEDGIAAVRAILPRCYFDGQNCKDGIHDLRCYQYDYDKDLRTYSRKPLHDFASHTADAFRTLAVTIKEEKQQQQSHAEPPPRIGVWS